MNKNLLTHIILATIGAWNLTGAQNSEPEIISVDFSVYLWPAADMSTYHGAQTEEEKQRDFLPAYRSPEFLYSSDSGLKRILVNHARQSPFYKYTGAPRLSFYREEQGEEGTITVPQGHVDIPLEWKRVLLIGIDAGPDSEQPYRFFPVNLTEGSIPEGQARLFNISSRMLYAKVGNEEKIIPPRGMVTVSIAEVQDFQLPFRFAIDDQGEKRIIYSTKRPILPDQSPLFIVFSPDPLRADLRMLTLQSS